MIIGTAGHIDHGKTTLVKALTGVDADRLPEEKKRGITIELGYAFMEVPGLGAGEDQRVGFIDVPGHERLVHTMLAGATGIDFALLLVAADDGVMPQTREHLALLSLLGLTQGAVVITKADRADAARLAAVQAEVAALTEGTALQGAPVFTVSAYTGQGVADLRAALEEAARGFAGRVQDGRAFRLAIDRAFTLDGVGTVLAGTVHTGTVAVGDTLQLTPGDASLQVRVRSVHAQNRKVTQAVAGQRCALAVAGVAKDGVQRGQWLVAPGAASATARLDVLLTVWAGEAKALRSGTPVHVHIGAQAVMGTVAVLDDGQGELRDTLAPGQQGRAQLVLHQPVGAWHGDRVVLRDAAATRAVAGGTVLDPLAPVRYRRTPQRLAELSALQQPGTADRLGGLLACSPQGVNLQAFAAAQGLPGPAPLLAAVPPDALLQQDSHAVAALGPAQRQQLTGAVCAALAQFHKAHEEELGPDAARLRRLACPRLGDGLWRALLADLQARQLLQVRGAFVHLPDHGVRLSAADERIAQKAGPHLAAAGFEGAWARDLARDCAEPEPLMRTTLARLAQRGELHQVVKDLYYPPATMAKLAALARGVAAQGDGAAVTAAAFRDATGLGRKRAIQVLEYLDRIGLFRRVGDVHRLRVDSHLFQSEAQ